MIRKILATGLLISSLAAPAMAQQSAPSAEATTNGGALPGGLSAQDVTGKRLLDADGNTIGSIVAVSPDGKSAIVQPAGGGAHIQVAMAGLSLGTGPHTVIDETNSSAKALNDKNNVAKTVEEHTETVTPGPTVTTTSTFHQSTSTSQ